MFSVYNKMSYHLTNRFALIWPQNRVEGMLQNFYFLFMYTLFYFGGTILRISIIKRLKQNSAGVFCPLFFCRCPKLVLCWWILRQVIFWGRCFFLLEIIFLSIFVAKYEVLLGKQIQKNTKEELKKDLKKSAHLNISQPETSQLLHDARQKHERWDTTDNIWGP